MASKQSGAGGSGDVNPKLEFKFLEDELGRVFTLIVDSRMPAYHQNLALEPIASDYRLLVPRTIVKWSKVMWAYLTNTEISKEDDVSVLSMPIMRDGKEIVLEPSQFDPYVTVWNLSIPNAPKIFMNTRDLPSDVLALTKEHVLGVSDFYRYSSKFGMVRIGIAETYEQSSITPDTPANVTPLPPRATPQQTQSQGNSKAFPQYEAHKIRQSKWGAEGVLLLLQEFVQGKSDESKFDKVAKIATKPYNRTEIQYDNNDKIAYHINGSLKVSELNGNLKVDIPIDNGYPVSVFIKPGDDNAYDWKSLRDVLGIGKEGENQLEAGQEMYLDDECYLVLKCSNSGDKQYKNFYNIYYAPSS